MKPLQHAQVAAHRYGGSWQDWISIHAFFDQSKAHFASMQHRALLHSDFGCALATDLFGPTIQASDGRAVPTTALAEDHQIEDLGRVVGLAEWLAELDARPLERGRRPAPPRLAAILTDPMATLARRYGGTPEEYAPLVAFFDRPAAFAPGDARAIWILHNSFGIFLAEQIFGQVRMLAAGRLVSTRCVGEDLVLARLGFIPSAAAVVSRIHLRMWMRGTEVRAALRARGATPQELALVDDPADVPSAPRPLSACAGAAV